jgi:hypothetical protein
MGHSLMDWEGPHLVKVKSLPIFTSFWSFPNYCLLLSRKCPNISLYQYMLIIFSCFLCCILDNFITNVFPCSKSLSRIVMVTNLSVVFNFNDYFSFFIISLWY